MRFTVYILYSALLDKYYVGYTSGPIAERIKKHLQKHRGFTAKAKDWILVYSESYPDKSLAMGREKQIKSWKSRLKIELLISSGHD